MKKLYAVVLLLILSSCATKVPPQDAPLVVVKTPEELVIACIHKYDSALNFKYKGEATVYKQDLFGETLYIFEYVTVSGEKVHISNYDMVNYDCGKAN